MYDRVAHGIQSPEQPLPLAAKQRGPEGTVVIWRFEPSLDQDCAIGTPNLKHSNAEPDAIHPTREHKGFCPVYMEQGKLDAGRYAVDHQDTDEMLIARHS